MSIIPRLLAGEATDAVDLNVVRHFLGGGKKTNKQVRRFAESAKKSDIGGDAGFDEMTAAQQRDFISSSKTYAAKRIKRHEDVTGYTGTGRVPEEAAAPKEAPTAKTPCWMCQRSAAGYSLPVVESPASPKSSRLSTSSSCSLSPISSSSPPIPFGPIEYSR